LCLITVAAGCSHEEKKTGTQTYEPPKLRSKAERQVSMAATATQNTDRRPTLGMRMSEVETIQGKPDRVDVMGYPGSDETIEQWRYDALQNGCRTVVFTNKRVSLLRECVGASNVTGTRSP
jgi:hypothetical protein